LKKIASFEVNHLTLKPGIYISRIDGDITTYDIRLKKPNNGDYLDVAAMHTIEHIVATYVRNSDFSGQVIYFGPMGCRTGFYLLVRKIDEADVIKLIIDAFSFLAVFNEAIPGTTASECGNYLEHNLTIAKKEAKNFVDGVKNYTVSSLKY